MVIKSSAKSPSYIKKGGWKADLAKILKEKGKYTTDGNKVVSFATTQARREALFIIFRELRDTLGYKIQNIENLTGKHIHSLMKLYEDRYKEGLLSAATIINRLSHLRTFSKWIHKEGLIKPIEYYIDTPIKKSTKLKELKSWSNKGIDAFDKIEQIRRDVSLKEDIRNRVADALLLQLLFGLRSKESLLLKPHLADKNAILNINHGAKGGRNRFIPIENEPQRELLNKIKSYVGLNESMVPSDKSYETFRRTYYNVLIKHNITKKDGITAHGLRHQHLNNLYEEIVRSKIEEYKQNKEICN